MNIIDKLSETGSVYGGKQRSPSTQPKRKKKSPVLASPSMMPQLTTMVDITRVERVVGFLQSMKGERVSDALLHFVYEMKNVLGVYSAIVVMIDKEYQQLFLDRMWHSKNKAHLKKFNIGGELYDGVVESADDNIDFVFNDLSQFKGAAKEA